MEEEKLSTPEEICRISLKLHEQRLELRKIQEAIRCSEFEIRLALMRYNDECRKTYV